MADALGYHRRSMRLLLLLVTVGVALAATPRTTRADVPAWAVGVSERDKAIAKRHLDEGNALFLERKYADAMERYRAALAAWDHPAIRFNLVRCLVQLDRPVEASDHLRLALRYGAAALEDTVYAEAVAYDKLLSAQIARLTVRCAQPGVQVTLDGEAVGVCPLRQERRVRPGAHQLVGLQDGFLTRTLEIVAVGGQGQELALTLDPLSRAARVEHRWPEWVPWTVLAGGFAATGLGVVVDLAAAQQRDSYDSIVAQKCAARACDPQADLTAAERALDVSARRTSRIAVGVMTVGGAAIATGVMLLYLNRGRTVYPSALERWIEPSSLRVTPPYAPGR